MTSKTMLHLPAASAPAGATEGVTISVDDDVYTGITPEGFNSFFEEKVLKRIREERV